MREIGVVGLILGVKSYVLEQQNLAVLQLADRNPSRLADAVLGEMDLAVEGARQVQRDRPEREIGLRAFGPAEVRHDYDHRTALGQVEEGRNGGPDPGVVADGTFRHRYVEVLAHEYALARDVHRRDRCFQSCSAI